MSPPQVPKNAKQNYQATFNKLVEMRHNFYERRRI